MTRTPDEIKKGLECCYYPVESMLKCDKCPYHGSVVCKMRLHSDAFALINRLDKDCVDSENHATALLDRIEQLEAERDALMQDMRECSHCAHHDVDEIYTDCCYDCNACDHDSCPCKECSGYNKWEWRGVQKEE